MENVNKWTQKKCLVAMLTVLAALGLPGAVFAQANIEAASYNNQNSAQTENCAEGGLDVGYISNGSWLEYNQLNLNGATAFQARVASGGSGGTISIHLDSPTGTVIGTCAVSPTDGWQTWATVTANLYGASGFHNVYLVFTGAGGLFNVEWFALINAGAQTQAANFSNASNVQTENCSEGGRDVGYLVNGSYIEFNQMNLNGVTTFNARTASGASGGNISIHVDSPTGTLIGTVQVPPTGGWQNWSTESVPVSGAAGYHNVYLVFSAGFNVEWFSLLNSAHTEAASYNAANNVKTENCSEGGLDVGYIVNGSYLEFNQLNLKGATSFTARTASGASGGSIAVHLDSPTGTLIGAMTATGTGGWQTWNTQTISLNGAGGYHNVYLVFTGGLNIQWLTFGNAAPSSSSSSSSSSAVSSAASSSSPSSSGGLSMLHAAGTQIVNASGMPVQLKGVNLGSLMLMEGWMCPLDSGGLDNYSVIKTLDSRFGVAAEQNMIHCYQTNWITTTDLQNIKNAGFNCVRVPVWWGDFYTLASYGANSGWRSDAFTELDWVVNNCAKYGLYVIIDMHGVVGGQSTSITCGQQNQNTYWYNANYQGDTAWMWWQIANHYKGNATVAGYDLINEPIGAPSASAVWYQYNSLYGSIRSADPGHMIIMEGAFGNWNWSMLPNPAVYGWSNVAYEMHEYQYNAPLAQVEQGSQDQVGDFNAHKSWNVPGYVGEFNDMLNSPSCWDYSINLYNSAGMSWTMWAYKAAQGLLPDNWGWYDPKYMPPTPNISTDSAATIYSDWQQWQTPSAFTQNSTIGL
jgi:aryl-phospho-beta-D-glucosidase BglC (GH1 family)